MAIQIERSRADIRKKDISVPALDRECLGQGDLAADLPVELRSHMIHAFGRVDVFERKILNRFRGTSQHGAYGVVAQDKATRFGIGHQNAVTGRLEDGHQGSFGSLPLGLHRHAVKREGNVAGNLHE